MNAVTHGLFAQKLVLNDEDSRRLETLRRSLHAELAPNTVLQEVQFERIVACMGRCSLALSVEKRHFNRLLGEDGEHRSQSDEPPGHVEWYLSGKQPLKDGLRLVESVKQDFANLGRIDEKWHDLLDKAFGTQFSATTDPVGTRQSGCGFIGASPGPPLRDLPYASTSARRKRRIQR